MLRERMRALVAGAAMMADVEGEAVFSGGSTTMKDNTVLGDIWRANLEGAGRVDEGVDPEHIGSSDMGNVSHVVPSIHPMIGIETHGSVNHQAAFADACAEPSADQAILDGALAMALTIIDAASDKAVRTRLLG